MRIACGIWVPLDPRSGGTSKFDQSHRSPYLLAMLTRPLISFLVKDAQQDMAGERLKA